MSPSVAQKSGTYSSQQAIDDEHTYAANNYHPLPVVIARGDGPLVYDPEGKEYLDFLSAYSAVNQGHCHPKIIDALTTQAAKLTLSSRAFYNDVFPQFAKFVTEFFGYESVLPMCVVESMQRAHTDDNPGTQVLKQLKLESKWHEDGDT